MEQKFSILYNEFYEKSSRFVHLYIKNDYIADDIVSESLIKLWEVSKKKEIKNNTAFLVTILRNKSLDYLRSQKVKQKSLKKIQEIHNKDLTIKINNLEACNPDQLFTSEIQDILVKTLRKLPRTTRLIFFKHHIKNQHIRDLAEEFGISIKGVDYHISKATKALRVTLKDYI